MKKVFLFAIIAISFSATLFAQKASHKHHNNMTHAMFTCPMHPEVMQSWPGKCPKCSMALVKTTKQMYTCPMHADVMQSTKGKCPTCDKTLVKAETCMYCCPMHKDKMKNMEGKCPKCGMDMKKGSTKGMKM